MERAEPAGLHRLWDAIADRLQRNGLQPAGSVRLDGLSHDERRALGGLLGRRIDLTADATTIDLARLDARLRRAGRPGVVEEAERRSGPLTDRAGIRSARAAADAELWAAARDASTGAGLDRVAWIEAWLAAIRPVVVRAQPADRLALVDAASRCITTVLEASDRPRGRTELASAIAGNAHALDDGRRLSAIVLRGLALHCEVDAPVTAAQRRELWRDCGVLCDEISTTVLCAGLRPADDGAAGTMVRTRTEHGWPTHLTIRDLDLLRWPASSAVVNVCENPRVVERALDDGAAAPLVCTQGNPTVVTRRLLESLADAGASFRYHGDFDWPGVGIANGVFAELPCRPWRFVADDYREALEHAGLLAVELPALSDRVVVARWDEGLSSAMAADGRAVHEELVLDTLVADLLGEAPESG